VRLGRNQRQSRAEERMLERNTVWEIHSKEENLEEDHIEEEKDRSYGRQEFQTPEEDMKIEGISIGEPKQDQGQWQ